MSVRNVAVCISSLLVCQGCYTYTPIDVADLTPQMEVRAEVTPAERESLADVLPGDNRVLEGTFISRSGDELLLQVEAVAAQRGVRLETLDQRIGVDPAGVLQLELKEKDQAKTIGLAALIAGGVATVVIIATQGGGAEDPGNIGPGGPQDAVTPIFRIPIGW